MYPSSPPLVKPRPCGAKASVLIGPKWPPMEPSSSSYTWSKKTDSKWPCLAEVVVTDMASCPPPAMRYGHLGSGEMHAELSGRSESNFLMSDSVFGSKMRTTLSSDDVTSSVMSMLNCM